MGYNRSGHERTKRLKRRKRLEERLAQKAAVQKNGGLITAPEKLLVAVLQEVSQWLKDHEQELLDDTRRMLRIPSIEGDPETNAPFGKENREALDLASSYLLPMRSCQEKSPDLPVAACMRRRPGRNGAPARHSTP